MDTRNFVTGASLALALLCAAGPYTNPSMMRPPATRRQRGTRPRGPGGAGGGQASAVASRARGHRSGERRQINVGIEAIGNAGANESVNISSKTTNIVTAIISVTARRCAAGQVLVELDRAQASADLAAATALAESQSQFNRSRD